MALVDVSERQFADDAVQAVRTAVQMQYQLSAMADQKAGLLMGASFVVFTIAMANAIARGGELPVAMMILGAAAFLAAILPPYRCCRRSAAVLTSGAI